MSEFFYGKKDAWLRYQPMMSSSMYVCDECYGMAGLPEQVVHKKGCLNASDEPFVPGKERGES